MKPSFAILLLLFPLAMSIAAQPPRNRPAPKRTEAEVRDPLKEAAALFETGQEEHQKGNLPRAIELYGEALKNDPELWQAEYQRANAFFALNKLTEARTSIARVEELLKQYPASPEIKPILARVQLTMGEIALAESNTAEAEKAFRRVLEIDAQSARAHSGLAEILLAAKKYDEAITEGKAALAAGDDRPATWLLLGIAESQRMKFADAVPYFDGVLMREPNNKIALLYRAEAKIGQKRLNEAISDLRAALAIDPVVATKLRLARALAESKQFVEAIQFGEEVLKAEPANTEAQTLVAAAKIESGNAVDAVVQLEALVKAEPNRAGLRAQLAGLYLATQPEKALEQYKAAAGIEANQPGHQIGQASALVKLRRFQEAVALLRPLLENAGSKLTEDQAYVAHTNLATALFELDDFPNAAREFVWVLNHQREQKRAAITLYFLGICFDKLGDYEQALKAYQQFLSLASTDNQLEIEKVRLRLPPLERQIKEGKGKRKP